jgi:ATP-dependent Lon protease
MPNDNVKLAIRTILMRVSVNIKVQKYKNKKWLYFHIYTFTSYPLTYVSITIIITHMNPSFSTSIDEDIRFLEEKIRSSNCPPDLLEDVERRISRMVKTAQYGGFSAEFESVSKYVDWVAKMPWGKYTVDNISLATVKKVLDKHNYGIEKVKERILEYVSIMKLRMDQSGGEVVDSPIMCFVGLQGIGKTSLAKAIGEAMGRTTIRISMGGLGDTQELRGKPKTESDSEPGQIVKALTKSGSMNPLIILDEIDKVSGNIALRKDFMSILLEILDPEQNPTFRDHFIDYPIDLSKVFFICTANNLGNISAALLDRLEIVRFYSYTDEEKIVIGRDYVLPDIMKETGLTPDQLEFTADSWDTIVRPLGFDAGIRQLKRNLYSICRKVAKIIVLGRAKKVVINGTNAKSFIDESFGIM